MSEPPLQPTKTFTVSEANALLPTVRTLVEQIQGLERSIVQTNQQLDELVGKLSAGNGYPIASLKDEIRDRMKHQLQLLEAFQSTLKQLEDLGCLVKDVNIGLVDFYTVRNGEIVLLCWKLGEERIQAWHTADEGYAGRRPIEG